MRVEKDPNNIKAIVDKLEKKDYVKRLKNPNDKRAFLLKLTVSGYELVEKLKLLDEEIILTICKDLNKGETKILKKILSKIVINLEV